MSRSPGGHDEAVPTLERATAPDLRDIALAADDRLQQASPQDVIRWAVETFGERVVATSSMGDALLAQLAAEAAPGIEVVFLDTGYHFAETLATRDAVAATSDIRLRNVLPLLTVEGQDAAFGPRLHDRDPDACCRLRKVAPLDRALAGHDAWISGNRRDDSGARADTPVVGFDERRGMVAVHPLATWTNEQVRTYVVEHGVIVNPLQDRGYPSIGCAPCTRSVGPDEDPRAGRWSGRGKTECGIHV